MKSQFEEYIVTFDFYENYGITPNLTRDLFINSLPDSITFLNKILRNILSDPKETKKYSKEGWLIHLKVNKINGLIHFIEVFMPERFSKGKEELFNKINKRPRVIFSPFFQIWENMYKEFDSNIKLNDYNLKGQILTHIQEFLFKYENLDNLEVKGRLLKMEGEIKRKQGLIFDLP